MNKKILLTILVVCFSLFLIAGVSASVDVRYSAKYGIIENDGSLTQMSGDVSNWDVEGYVCLNSDCSDIGSQVSGLTGHTSSNQIILTFPTNQVSSYGYALYFHKSGYIGWHQIKVKISGTGTHVYDVPNIFLSKKRTGWSPITNLNVVNTEEINKPITIDVDVGIDAETYAAIEDARLSDISLQEDVLTEVTLEIYDGTGTTIHTESKNIDIDYSGTESVDFAYAGFDTPGNYTVNVSTDVLDGKILNSIIQYSSKDIEILDTGQGDDYGYSLLGNLMYNPVFPETDEDVEFCFDYVSRYVDALGALSVVDTLVNILIYRESNLVFEDNERTLSGNSTYCFTEDFSQEGDYSIEIFGEPAGDFDPEISDYIDATFVVQGPDVPECEEGESELRQTGTTDVGECAFGQDLKTCVDGSWSYWETVTNPLGPSTEICDGLDNNCNGETDEGGVCDECCDDGDCSDDFYSADYCAGDDLYKNFTNWFCSQGNCDFTFSSIFIEECEFGCAGGECNDDPGCTEDLQFTEWSIWDNSICYEGQRSQSRFRVEYDASNCGTFENATRWDSRLVDDPSCESCTEDLQFTDWSSWANQQCVEEGVRSQSRFKVEYDASECGTFTNQTSWDYRNVSDATCDEPTECCTDGDCPEDGYSDNYCYNEDLYKNFNDWRCDSGTCRVSVQRILVETCEYGCAGSVCNDENESEEFIVWITNPLEGEVFTSLNVDLQVSANQEVDLWKYNVNNNGNITIISLGGFTFSRILNQGDGLVEGDNLIVVYGINGNGTASDQVMFSIDTSNDDPDDPDDDDHHNNGHRTIVLGNETEQFVYREIDLGGNLTSIELGQLAKGGAKGDFDWLSFLWWAILIILVVLIVLALILIFRR